MRVGAPVLLIVIVVLVGAVCVGGASGAAAGTCVSNGPWRSLVIVSAKTGAIDRSFPDAEGSGGPSVVVSDGRGGWFVAGGGCVGGVHVAGVYRLRSNGTLDRAWRAAIPYGPFGPKALTLVGNTLYAGGFFGVEALNATTGARRWMTPVNTTPVYWSTRTGARHFPPTNEGPGDVVALAANSQSVFAGGLITSIGGVGRQCAAALDPTTGRVLPWRTQAPCPSGGVQAMALTGRRLFVSGELVPNKAEGLYEVDTISGHLNTWTPATEPNDVTLGAGGSLLIAHGEVLIGDQSQGGWGAANVVTGRIEPWIYEVRGSAPSFASAGNVVYLGGGLEWGFAAVDGHARNNLAAINLITGQFTNWAPDIDPYVTVTSMAASGNKLLVAGYFSATVG